MKLKCRLKVIFAERDIKQGEFAQKVGISSGALSSIVNGRSFPSFSITYKISNELDLDIREIWVKL